MKQLAWFLGMVAFVVALIAAVATVAVLAANSKLVAGSVAAVFVGCIVYETWATAGAISRLP